MLWLLVSFLPTVALAQRQPSATYLWRDRWSVGLDGRFQANAQQPVRIGLGISTRYYLLKTKKIAVFGQVGYFLGQPVARQYSFNNSDPAHPTLTRYESRPIDGTVVVGIGLRYRFGKR